MGFLRSRQEEIIMDYMYSGPVLIVNLDKKELEEVEIEIDQIEDTLGGAGIMASLYEEHADGDPIVIGTGICTATTVPGSALGMITAKKPDHAKSQPRPLRCYGRRGIEIQWLQLYCY